MTMNARGERAHTRIAVVVVVASAGRHMALVFCYQIITCQFLVVHQYIELWMARNS